MRDEQTHERPSDVPPEAPPPPEARPGVPPESPKPDEKRHGIALCLSGGGFRASLFHLGSLRRLHEVGVLQQVRTISCVSGGSIFGGCLAGLMIEKGMSGLQFEDWEKDVAAGFRQFAGRDLRTWPMVAHLPWNWAVPGLRVNHLVGRYRNRLTSRKLGELPRTPNFIFCATDLTFGVNWSFCRGRSGDYQAGYTNVTDDWPIARAVAASACFPPLFGPMPLGLAPEDLKGGKYKGKDRDDLVRRIGLSDGGVYDNMAMEPAWKTHECVLVSDCGAPFGHEAGGHYFKRLMRYTGVVMNQAAAVRKRAFFADISEKDPKRPRRYRGGYWGIAGTVEGYLEDWNGAGAPRERYSPSLVGNFIDAVRTDLDRFTDAETRVLENHGYLVTAAVMARRRNDLIARDAPAPAAPHGDWMKDEKRVENAMAHSHLRLSHRRLLRRGDYA